MVIGTYAKVSYLPVFGVFWGLPVLHNAAYSLDLYTLQGYI